MTSMAGGIDYQRGDRVVHTNFGVGRIASIEEMQYNDTAPGLFYRVDFDKTSLWVPVSASLAGKLRPITQNGELSRYRTLLKSPPSRLEGDFRVRQDGLEKRKQLGTFQSLCELVRDLSARNSNQNLSSFERGLLRQTRAALVEEWAAASGNSLEDASGEIDEFLLKGRQVDDPTT